MPIESLKKLEYQDLAQFIEDINKNFAIIETSPLYKGVPGEAGEDGLQGLRGVRGIRFFFADYDKFIIQFPGELSVASQITLNFINSKVSVFSDKQKLLLALGTTELVDKDVIILPSTAMLSYDFVGEQFVNTGIAFNPENSLNNIQKIIEDYVVYYINNNPTLNNLTNVFQTYQTYAKNFADNNNTFITSELTESSVFSPYIPGFNNTVGIHIDNHRYFGYTDSQFPLANKGTFVFGSMKRYYQLLMNTISTAGNNSLSSDYSPGAGNIPAAVFMQDTYRNGIYFGHKDKANLKRFGSIFKNENDDLIIKSDSSTIESEYSELAINRNYMRFKKLVQFYDSLEVSRNLSVFGDINNKYVKTGSQIPGANQGNNFHNNRSMFGSSESNSVKLNASEFEEYVHYLGNVLVTDTSGRVSKDYKLESTVMNNTQLLDLNQITNIPNSPLRVLTSNYFLFLATKINNMNSYIGSNYWRKSQYGTGEIPDLVLSNKLTAGGEVKLGGNQVEITPFDFTTKLNSDYLEINSFAVKLANFQNSVLTTDVNGNLNTQYHVETGNIFVPTPDPTTGYFFINQLGGAFAANNFVTSKHVNKLIDAINLININVSGNFWRKNQYFTGEIPSLWLSDTLYVGGNVSVFDTYGTHISKTIVSNRTVLRFGNNATGSTSTQVRFETDSISLTKHINRVLVTDNNGTILNTYFLFAGEIGFNFQTLTNLSGVTYQFPVLTMPGATTDQINNSIPVWKHVRQLGIAITNLISWIGSNFWRKDQFTTGEIPAMKISGSLEAGGNVQFGPASNPNIKTTGNVTQIGANGTGAVVLRGSIKFDEFPNKILVTDNTGFLEPSYELMDTHPWSTNSGLPAGSYNAYDQEVIRQIFWRKEIPGQDFASIQTSPYSIMTANYFGWIVNNFRAIRTLIYNRPTYDEMALAALPKGSIVMWNGLFGGIPSGFLLCNGQAIPGTFPVKYAPNLVGNFIKASDTANVISGNTNNQVTLLLQNIPSHNHSVPEHHHKMFVNQFKQGGSISSSSESYVPYAAFDVDSNPYDYNMASATSGAPSLGRTGNNTGSLYTGNAGQASPTAVNIEPKSYSLMYLIKYV